MKNIYLIGFMGTGKTTTGRLLAERLGTVFIDMDAEIERESGRCIPEIFATDGEAHFRDMEKAMMRRVAKRSNAVVATGGGTVKDAENRTILHASGTVIALFADVDTVLERTQTRGERPLLDTVDEMDRKKAIEEMLVARKSFYEDADYAIDTSGRTPLEVAEEILSKLRRS